MALEIYLFYCGADHNSDLTSCGASHSLFFLSCDCFAPIMFIFSLNCYIVFLISIAFLLRTLVPYNFILTYIWITSSLQLF